MIAPVFNKEDFNLCRITVPEGYPQSLTHAGIAYFDNKYYLTCSPYPVKKYSWIESHWLSLLQRLSFGRWGGILDAEKYENPLLYIGIENDGNPPVFFSPARPFPLMDTPKPMYGLPAYNSDPDVFIEDGKVFILNRTYYRKTSQSGGLEKEVLLSLIEGDVEKTGFHLKSVSEFKRSFSSFISPCLAKLGGKYLLASLETNSAIDGHTFGGLFLQQADSIYGLKDVKEKTTVEIESSGLLPWHISLFTYKEKLYAIIACVQKGDTSHVWQMIGAFNETLTKLKIYSRPLTDYNSYRGAAIVLDGKFILYTTTLNDRVPGSVSIDGRDIIVAETNFEDLLTKITER